MPSTSCSLDGSKPSFRLTAKAGWPVLDVPVLEVPVLDVPVLDVPVLEVVVPGRHGWFGGISQRSNHCWVSSLTRLVSWLPPSWPPANQTMPAGAPFCLIAW